MRPVIIPIASFILLATSACAAPPPPVSYLRLSNFSIDRAHVQTLVQATPYCGWPREPRAVLSDFILPLNGTRFVTVLPPAGYVCWRHQLPAGSAGGQWSDWSHADLATAPGRVVDSTL